MLFETGLFYSPLCRSCGSTACLFQYSLGGGNCRTTLPRRDVHRIKFACFKFTFQSFLVQLQRCANITAAQRGNIFLTCRCPACATVPAPSPGPGSAQVHRVCSHRGGTFGVLAVRATVSGRSCRSWAPSFAALPGTPENGLGEGVAAVICLLSVSIFSWASLSLDWM